MAALAAGFAAGALATGALAAVAFAAGAFAGAVALAFGATALAAVALGAAVLLAAAFGAAVLVAFGAALAAGLAAATAFAGAFVGVAIEIPFNKVMFFRGASQCTAWNKCDDVTTQSKSCECEESKIKVNSFETRASSRTRMNTFPMSRHAQRAGLYLRHVPACSAGAQCGTVLRTVIADIMLTVNKRRLRPACSAGAPQSGSKWNTTCVGRNKLRAVTALDLVPLHVVPRAASA